MQKLFIFIPTYNRPQALAAQLSALLPQLQKYPHNVRVVVRDNNSSNYEIADLANQFKSDSISFERNFGNIGGNANIALGFVLSREDEFLWILSDNDTVRPDCLEYLAQQLQSSVDFVVINDQHMVPETMKWKWADGWVTPMAWRQGLISNALFNTNTIRSSIDDAFFFHNSSFPHLAVACSAAKKKGEVVFLHLPNSSVHEDPYSDRENPGDYSLSQVGMPQLIKLFPEKPARDFSLGWLHKNGWLFYKSREKYPEIFVSSRHLLVKSGGLPSYFYLAKAWVLFKSHEKLDKFIELARAKFPKGILALLKKMSSILGYR